MHFLKTVFPFSFPPVDVRAFIITLVIYAVVGAAAGLVIGLLSKLWLIGWIFSLVGGLVDLYVLVGIILTVLSYTGLIQ